MFVFIIIRLFCNVFVDSIKYSYYIEAFDKKLYLPELFLILTFFLQNVSHCQAKKIVLLFKTIEVEYVKWFY